MRLLLIEDNARLASLLADGLAKEGFAVDWCATLDLATRAFASNPYDLVLLDLGMPDGNGVTFVKALRRGGHTVPVLIVTARSSLDDRVIGLDSGGDDYLVKPFELRELAARCRALLRRPGACLGTTLAVANLELDTAGREVRVAGRVVPVPPRELGLLECLMRRVGHVVTKGALEDSLYALEAEVTPNALEAVVSRLRRRLAAAHAQVALHTAHGIGYMLTGTSASASDGDGDGDGDEAQRNG
ncbi:MULTISPECIES: response regulator transcription factor [Burkholderia]|uniref:response regulator transcription factor n=1 Tax=Burkholderia TaxID=32008 RepID=UPI00075EFAE8|nr:MULTISPECIES: response regulator transcription factor [Burkholderia]KVE31991.1 two-component system response regulator [Burkholderia vietnamiensis]MBR8035072.1 response regulator transcription factor [Burkholderia vietnamiensis]MDN8035636.1 response regulator transcription factor [Burkholderia vietnamiensis]RQM60972.1 DNA-binding response regulator [Burkholderia vietnamiensis]CAG9193137.1 Transcriptional regulatory protein QseB [Burkholderia vietnamiensis]